MEKIFRTVLDQRGNAVPGVSVTIYLAGTQDLAQIYNDDGSEKTNPMQSDAKGRVSFRIANGEYDLRYSGGPPGMDDETLSGAIRAYDAAEGSSSDHADTDLGGKTIDFTGGNDRDIAAYDSATGEVRLMEPLADLGLENLFARVDARTDGWFWVRRSSVGTNAVVDFTQQGTGRIANFRSGAGDGSVVAWIDTLGGAEFSGDVVIHGGLTVLGDPVTVIGNEVNIGDSIMLLNSDETGSPVADGGIEIERGTSANVQFVWKESVDRWQWQDAAGTLYTVPGLNKADTWTAAQTFAANPILQNNVSFLAKNAGGANLNVAYVSASDIMVFGDTANSQTWIRVQELDDFAIDTSEDGRVYPFTWLAKTSAYVTKDGEQILADSSGGAFTLTLPASPRVGARVDIVDAGGAAAANNITIARNGSNIHGVAQDLILDVSDAAVTLVYYSASRGWVTVQR